MSQHFSMGAINKETEQYEYPKIANKKNKYKCPHCLKDVIFKKGKIKQPHFAHYKSENPCCYYDRPCESQIHKDAKMLMKKILDDKCNIFIERNCNYCQLNGQPLNYSDNYDIFSDDYTETTKAYIEYNFKYNDSNKYADIALLENDTIKYIFEIYYKHKTLETDRPEPWFEIKAEDLINKINSGEIIDKEGNIYLECIRNYKCDSCQYKEEIEKKQYNEVLEKLKTKEREQNLEKHELLLMIKEDYRKIELEAKLEEEKEKERIKRECEYKEKEKERIKRENEYKQKEKEKEKLKEEKQKRLDEYNKKIIELNKICSICNINYCKCISSNFIKDEYNIIKCCACNKRRCKCRRITDFFK